MPTYLRIIIMIGEIIGFLILSVAFIFKEYRSVEKVQNEKIRFYDIIRDSDVIFLIVHNMIIISCFLFMFPSFVFASYNKMICLSGVIISSAIFMLVVWKDIKKVEVAILGCFALAFALGFVLIGILFSVLNLPAIPIRTMIKQEETTEVIYPVMNLTDRSVIGYEKDFEGNIKYSFYYQDDSGNWCFKDGCEAEVVKIGDLEKSRVEKHIVEKSFKNIDEKTTSKNYISTEKEFFYILYVNEKQLIEIKTD